MRLGDWDLLLMQYMEHIWTMVMLKICKHTFYVYYPESFCDKNLAIRKVFAFCDSALSFFPLDSWVNPVKMLRIQTAYTSLVPVSLAQIQYNVLNALCPT